MKALSVSSPVPAARPVSSGPLRAPGVASVPAGAQALDHLGPTLPQAARPLPPVPPSVLDPNFRLPGSVQVKRYDVELTVDPAKELLAGEGTVDLSLKRPTQQLIVHAKDLSLDKVTLRCGGKTLVPARIDVVAPSETVVLTFRSRLPEGAAKLQMAWTAKYSEGTGLLTDGRIASSSLQPAGARTLLPCLDEPGFKARWKVALRVPRGTYAASNGPAVTTEAHGDYDRVQFQQTRPMSSYLFCVLTGPLVASKPTVVRGVPVRVISEPDKAPLGEFAQRESARAVDALSEYFGVRFPYPKLDVGCVPTEPSGMENAGLILMNDAFALLDPAKASFTDVQWAASTFVHEVAHQWFGDLVTLAWWNDLWLNEAFATWAEIKFTDLLNPQLGYGDWVKAGLDATLAEDALSSTLPIRREVKSAAEAASAFDGIVYSKGGALLRMLEAHLGEEVFRRGVHRYLREHRDGTATTEDFLRALAQAAGGDGRVVEEIAKAWLDQRGFPLVRVEVKDGAAHLSQKRFFSEVGKGDGTVWPIPLALRFEDDGGLQERRVLFRGKDMQVPLDATGRVRWLEANPGANGFHRCQYDAANQAALLEAGDKLPAIDRVTLLCDAWALACADQGAVGDYLRLNARAVTDADALVVERAKSAAQAVAKDLCTPPTQERFRAWLATQLRPRMTELGWTAQSGEPRERARLREAVVALAVASHDPQLAKEATERIVRFIEGDESALAPGLLSPAAELAATRGDAALLERMLEAAKTEPNPDRQLVYATAPARFENPELVDRLVEMSVGDGLTSTERYYFFRNLLQNPVAIEKTWKLFQTRWPEVRARLSPIDLPYILMELVNLKGPDRIQELEEFWRKNRVPEAENAFKQTLEKLRQRQALAARVDPEVARWLDG